jgi:hypothetical protein
MRYRTLLFAALALGACADGRPPTEPLAGGPPGSSRPDSTPATPPPGGTLPAPTPVGEPTGGASASAIIGAAGGTLVSADERIVVRVPAGALSTPTTVTVQPIRNHARGGTGVAYRLAPHGVVFAKPVRLSFRYTSEDGAGTSPQLLRVAHQDADRRWRMFRNAEIDTVARTVDVETTHFSDWSLVATVQLLPANARIAVGESLQLAVKDCKLPEIPGTDLAPLVYECRDGHSALLTGEWYVNGEETHETDGVITPSATAFGRATYRAPEILPRGNPVAVSVEYTTLSRARELLVSHVEVVRDSTISAFSYQSSARYDLSWVEGSERVTGDANAYQKIETEWTVTRVGTEAGRRVYRLQGVNRITLDANANFASAGADGGRYSSTTTALLKGGGISRNPETSTEWMTGIGVAPEGSGPDPLQAGRLRTWTEGDRHLYDFTYRPSQVVPTAFKATSEERWRCRDESAAATRVISFDNNERRTSVTADDPFECFQRRGSRDWPGPFMFGSLSWDATASHPDGGRWTTLRGSYDPKAGYIEGVMVGQVTGCAQVWRLDPVQWFAQVQPHIAANAVPDLRSMGACTLAYRMEWRIILPD